MKSPERFWLAATAVVLASLAPKMVLSVLRQGSAAAARAAPNDSLRAFLVTATGAPVEPVRPKGAQAGSGVIAGWRFRSAGCADQAFLSDLPGNLDFQAHALAPKGARVSYVYRGLVSARPPTARLAFDVMASRSLAEFSPASAAEPRYVVVVVPGDCPPPALPWVRLRLN